MPKQRQISGFGMVMGFAPTWLCQVSPPASQNHFNHCLGLSVLDLGPMYATDKTDKYMSDVRQHRRLMPPPTGRGHNKLSGRPPQYAPAPCKLAFDLLILKVVSESRVTWASYPCANFSHPIDHVLDLGPMYATDRRQTRIIA